MGEQFEKLKNIKLLNTGLVKKSDSIYKYLLEKNVDTVADLIEYYEENKSNYRKNINLFVVYGLVDLCKFKYLNEYSNNIMMFLNSYYKYWDRYSSDIENKHDYCKYMALGLSFYDCWYIYSASKTFNVPGKKFIEYISDLYEGNHVDGTPQLYNKIELLIKFYDTYKNEFDNEKRVKL